MLAFYLSEIDKEENKLKFEEIYHCYAKEMFVIANRILNNKENAEDAVQDAFVVIMRKLDTIQDVHAKGTSNYIRVIVKNKAINIYNRCKKGEVLTEDYNFLSDLSENLPDVEGQIEKMDMADIISDMILALPDKYREVLYLYYYNEMSYAEVANVLDTTEGNARQIARRARKILEEKMVERGLRYE